MSTSAAPAIANVFVPELNVIVEASTSAPPVPENTTRVAVKSSMIAEARVASPSTSNVVLKSTAPSTSKAPAVITLPLPAVTRNLSVPDVPTLNVVPSKVKFASSSSSPEVPAITIRLFVRSSTFTEARVD